MRLVRWRRTRRSSITRTSWMFGGFRRTIRTPPTERDLTFGVSRMTVCGGSSPESLPISHCVIEPSDSNISNSGMLFLG